MIWISSGDDIVWAVSASGAIWYRLVWDNYILFFINFRSVFLEQGLIQACHLGAIGLKSI